SYRDFLIFAQTIERLEGGVLLNVGSAIMGPEVYLKALAMARNVAHQEGRTIRHFTTAAFDLVPIQGFHRRSLSKADPGYWLRLRVGGRAGAWRDWIEKRSALVDDADLHVYEADQSRHTRRGPATSRFRIHTPCPVGSRTGCPRGSWRSMAPQ